MNKEIKQILDKATPYLFGDEVDKLLDYITNLQTIEQEYSFILSENAELRIDISARETICDDYKSRIDKALSWTNRVIEIIKQQPSEDDTWILDNLQSIKYLLQGSDK